MEHHLLSICVLLDCSYVFSLRSSYASQVSSSPFLLTAGTKANFLAEAAIAVIHPTPAFPSPLFVATAAYYDQSFQDVYGAVPYYDIHGNSYKWLSTRYLSFCFGNYGSDGYGNVNGKINISCSTSLSQGTKVFQVEKAFVPWTARVGFTGQLS